MHGFNGFTDDINPSVLAHYWGGNKMNIRQDLEENGKKAYEASISAFGSSSDRAVELSIYVRRRSCRLWCSTCSKIWT